MKFISFFFTGLFVLIAALQFNDPDPIYWVAVYSGTAFVILSRGLNRFNEFWSAVVIGALLAGMLWTAAGFWAYVQSGNYGAIFGDMLDPAYVEETREFLGLAVALSALLYFRRKGSKLILDA